MGLEQIRAVFQGTADLADFLNTNSLSGVSSIILDLARHENCPGWLRGVSTLSQLPKFDKMLPEDHVTPIMGWDNAKVSKSIRWLVEHGTGRWKLIENGIVHETVGELVHFKMMFG